MTQKQIPFGISFRSKKLDQYIWSELMNFIECSNNPDEFDEPDFAERYHALIHGILGGKIKPSTPVDLDLVEFFYSDLDNRAQMDYREDHWEDDPEITAGGKYFHQLAGKLKAHIKAHQ
jgi:hypothetical protein